MKKMVHISLGLLFAACSQESGQPKSDQFPGFVQIGPDKEISHLFIDLNSIERDANGNVMFKQLDVLDAGYAIHDATTNCRDTYKGFAGTKFTKDGVSESDYPADSTFTAYRDQPALSALVNKVCEKAEENRMITGAFDDIKALELIYGPYHPEFRAAYWKNVSPPERLSQESASGFSGKNGLVKVIFSEEYREGNDTKRILLTQTQLADEVNDCHACGILLGAITFVRVGDKWRIESDNRYLDVMGAYGVPPELAWVNLGKNTHAISVKMTDIHQGIISGYIGIFKLRDSGWEHILESFDEGETISGLHFNVNNSNPEQNYAEVTIHVEFDDEGKKSTVEKKYSFDGYRYQLKSPNDNSIKNNDNSSSTTIGNDMAGNQISRASATPNDPIPAPSHTVGDTYITEVINFTEGKPGIKTERKVVYVDDKKMVVESKSLSSKKGTVRSLDYTLEWNLLRSRNPDGSGLDYTPPLKYYDFPLFIGKKWQQTSIENNIKTGTQRTHTLSSEVFGWESVTVPAGTFKAIKVVTRSKLIDPDKGESTWGKDTSWYVPELRRSIKSETSSQKEGGTEEKQIIQLINHKIEK